MTVDPSQIEFGQSMPPHGPHTITVHAPGWDTAMRFRDGDMSVIMRMKSLYPRFGPFGVSAALCHAIAQKLQLPEGYTCAAFLSPDAWSANRARALSAFHREHRLAPADLRHHVVDAGGVRLYVVAFPAAKMMGAIFMWQHGGRGFSTRLAESLLPEVTSSQRQLVHVGEFPPDGCDGSSLPAPTYLPETESHGLLRERIAALLMRAPAAPHAVAVAADDVFLYPTGMAAIERFHAVAAAARPHGPVAVFGAVFHSTHHLFEESAAGARLYKRCDAADLDAFEAHLEAGGACSYVFTEFPSNPVMVCVDLVRLRKLADKHGFFLAVDDTCASFANIDLLAAADAVLTSLTKSFSGYADVMAGSVALNPNSARAYAALKPALAASFRNELFAADAARLLANSADFLARAAVLNRNAAALAAYFAALAADDDPASSPVRRVWYPPHSPGSAHHLAPFMRGATTELSSPGYGCLLSVEFATLEDAARFYDALNFVHGPHLGAHLSLALPYTAITYGKEKPEEYEPYGMNTRQIRISVGLEDEEVLLQRCKDAVAKMVEEGKK
ncbi:cystathionine gamma-synthase [Biscogniauxia mediterranea]|nr:cystathionine gamma-synthase [Biscogniauxia mediterranea]